MFPPFVDTYCVVKNLRKTLNNNILGKQLGQMEKNSFQRSLKHLKRKKKQSSTAHFMHSKLPGGSRLNKKQLIIYEQKLTSFISEHK